MEKFSASTTFEFSILLGELTKSKKEYLKKMLGEDLFSALVDLYTELENKTKERFKIKEEGDNLDSTEMKGLEGKITILIEKISKLLEQAKIFPMYAKKKNDLFWEGLLGDCRADVGTIITPSGEDFSELSNMDNQKN